MVGRYGNDRLNQVLMIVAMVALVISFFGPRLFYLIALLILIYAYFRMFSKNTYKRSMENNKYLQWEYKGKQFIAKKKRMFKQAKTHHIYQCPSCRQKIRVPRGKGRIEIRCPKCGQTFIKKS